MCFRRETCLFKNFLILGLACLAAVLALGFRPVQKALNEALNEGALEGAERCTEYSSSQLMSAEAVKAACVRLFQKRVYGGDPATGQAGPYLDKETVYWGGFLENKSSNYVTTWVQIEVQIYDKDGAKKVYVGETAVWIDPLGKADFQIEFTGLEREQLRDLEFCDLDDKAPKACMGWGVTDIMGLRL